jgi:hypothetical protein
MLSNMFGFIREARKDSRENNDRLDAFKTLGNY